MVSSRPRKWTRDGFLQVKVQTTWSRAPCEGTAHQRGKTRPAIVDPSVRWSLAGKPLRHNTLGGLLYRHPGRALSGGQELCEDACVRMPCCGSDLRSRGRSSLVHAGALGREADCQLATGSGGIRVTEPPADSHRVDLCL